MEVRDWIDFMELLSGDRQSLVDAWALVSPRMPQILDGFYRSRIVSGQKWRMKGLSLERLKASQFSYWEMLFSGVLDERYRARVRWVAARHFQAGVTMADYIASYGWFLNAFEREIAAVEPCGARHASLMASVRRVVLLDMTFAASACHVAYVD